MRSSRNFHGFAEFCRQVYKLLYERNSRELLNRPTRRPDRCDKYRRCLKVFGKFACVHYRNVVNAIILYLGTVYRNNSTPFVKKLSVHTNYEMPNYLVKILKRHNVSNANI